jgi:signal transduction histidine kinase
VLSAGFGGLILFILGAAAGTMFLLGRVRADDTRIRQAYLERLRVLEQIRSQIYLSGTDMRDYLLSPGIGAGERPRKDIVGIRLQTQRQLDEYARSVEPAEQDAFEALRSEINDWWQVVGVPFQWTPGERESLRISYFYEQLVPRRTTMLQIADRIAAINENGLTRSEERLSTSAGNLRWSLLVTFGITLIGGVLLAAATTGLTLRLEREVERRLRETMAARADFQSLSARLVNEHEEERRKLARELHDEVGQALSAIMMETGGAMASAKSDDVKSRLASISSLAERTLNTVRDLALLLRPSMLDDFGLVPALNWHARETSKRTGMSVRINADVSDDLPDEYRTCVYRVVQEAIHNAARHANARNVQVNVRNEGAFVVFSVQDDGTGFDKRSVRGMGLLGMEERVRRLGGELLIDSQTGRGTTVSAELPLPAIPEKPIYASHTDIAG